MNIMDEATYKSMLRESISAQFSNFEYYRTLCKRRNRTLQDIIHAIDQEEYYEIPAVSASAFKKSKGLLRELNDLMQEGVFQVSSSTSGDPSYVYSNKNELEKVRENYRTAFGQEDATMGIAFAPTLRILEALSKKSGYMGKRSIARMQFGIEAALTCFKSPTFTVDVNVIKTLMSKILGKDAVLTKKTLGEIEAVISEAERQSEKITLGGFVLLLRPYLDQMVDGQFHLNEKAFFTFSGGGYSGSKGSIRGAKVDKPALIRKIASVFGMEERFLSTNIKDVYGFTECSATNEGFWDVEIDDFLFESWYESRVYIVDPETEKPLTSGEGLLKFITPYANGNPSAANVSILQFDMATIRSTCPNLSVNRFSHIRRLENASMEGCAYKAESMSKK